MTSQAGLRNRLSAPVRATLLSLMFSVIITLPILLFVYRQTDRLFETRIVNRIDDRERNLLHGYRTRGIAGLTEEIDDEVGTGIARGGAILLVDASGRKVAGNLAVWPAKLHGPTRWTEMRLYPEGEQGEQLFALRVFRFSSGHRLLLGTNVEDRERMRDSLVEALLGAMILALPLGLLFGLLVVRITDRRAQAIASVATRIAAGDFSHRVDPGTESEEFGKVASAINAMLERIEELVEQLRIVTDSLAHDLRSPLTRIRANIERAATYATQDHQQQALEAVSIDIDRMLRLISATLEISRTEAGVGRQQFADFDLDALVRDICEIYFPVAEERGVSIEVEEPKELPIVGNRQLVGQAVANLVDNALKYASAGGRIVIGSNIEDGIIRLWVADNGPGIPSHLRDDALRKYRRLEEARTTEGSGLGLAFVRSVARLHGGEIELQDNAPGLRVLMTLRSASPRQLAARAEH